MCQVRRVALLFLCACLAEGSTVVVETDGTYLGGTVAAGLSAGWSSETGFQNVTITALLQNGDVFPSSGTAYLTTSIGPSSTPADLVAQANIEVTCGFCTQTVTLFTGLNLDAGTYWLTFGTPAPPVSYLSWVLNNEASAIAGQGVSYLGFHALASGYDPFPPGGSFIFPDLIGLPVAYQFSVTSEVPEPGTVWFSMIGAAALLARKAFHASPLAISEKRRKETQVLVTGNEWKGRIGTPTTAV